MIRRYWRVKLTETIGAQILEGWVRGIPANSEQEAREKAVRYIKKKIPGANPRAVEVDEEFQVGLGRTITVVHTDEAKGPLDLKRLLDLH